MGGVPRVLCGECRVPGAGCRGFVSRIAGLPLEATGCPVTAIGVCVPYAKPRSAAMGQLGGKEWHWHAGPVRRNGWQVDGVGLSQIKSLLGGLGRVRGIGKATRTEIANRNLRWGEEEE